ncbi:GGDEF domain-containing protein [Chitinilyticum piscinae]|uniref:diguanylate cyclase n=1 Tax=Chitinilyticum piscinae TaxID=2866724 RepID=A0A8J7FNW3_9NEIS|nr:GGDEF domain-containing protein [Chitinilyticum piscinae]MBE9607776.1 GGDEF domain-containing protein [Chitinilyticum piscinae]
MKTADSDHPAAIDERLAQAEAMYTVDCTVTIDLARDSALQSAQAGYRAGEIRALLWWGRSLAVLGRASEAMPRLRKALRLAQGQDEPEALAACHDAIAACHFALGNERQAVTSWLAALDSALAGEALSYYVEALNGIGNVYVLHEDHAAAFRFHASAVDFAAFQPDVDLRCKALLHLAADLVALERFELAAQTLHHAEQFLILPRRQNWQAEIYNYLGDIAMRQGALDAAERYLQQAYAINVEAKLLWGQTVNLLGLGRLRRRQGLHEQAASDLLAGLALAEQFHALHLLMQLHEELYQLYEARADYIRAVMHHVGYHTHFMALAQQDSSRRLQSLSVRRLANVEMRLRLLDSEMEINQLRKQTDDGLRRMQWLESAAYRDTLTGAFNRRAMDERLPELIRQARLAGVPFSALLLDFDHFKQINDRYSHFVGDKVLQQGARVFLELCRDSDLLVRFGGEEFLLFLPGAPLEIARKIGERICNRIPGEDWQSIQDGLRVTLSVGVGELGLDEQVPDWLLRIDQALYRAKAEGRNRVYLAEEA